MRAAAVALVLLAAAAPVADAKPHKCRARICRWVGVHLWQPHVAAPPMVPVNLSAPPVVTPPAPDTPPAQAARLGVTAREWSLVLSRPTLPAGPAIVELQNLGEDAHNLRIERIDAPGPPLSVPSAESGEVRSASGTLASGHYKVYCALPGHDAAGMHATLDVR
jgi:hypothetical protein